MSAEKTEVPAKKKFVVYFIGAGEGCDYVMACNKLLENLKSSTLEEAKKEVGKRLEVHAGYDNDNPMEKVVIYEVAQEIVFDLNTWFKNKQDEEEQDEENLTEIEERELLKKLKNKYEL